MIVWSFTYLDSRCPWAQQCLSIAQSSPRNLRFDYSDIRHAHPATISGGKGEGGVDSSSAGKFTLALD